MPSTRKTRETKAVQVLELMARSGLDKKGKVIRQGKSPPEARLYKRNYCINWDSFNGYRHRAKVLSFLFLLSTALNSKAVTSLSSKTTSLPISVTSLTTVSDCLTLSRCFGRRNLLTQMRSSRHGRGCATISRRTTTYLRRKRSLRSNGGTNGINSWIDGIPQRIIQILEQVGDNNFRR